MGIGSVLLNVCKSGSKDCSRNFSPYKVKLCYSNLVVRFLIVANINLNKSKFKGLTCLSTIKTLKLK